MQHAHNLDVRLSYTIENCIRMHQYGAQVGQYLFARTPDQRPIAEPARGDINVAQQLVGNVG